MQQKHPPLVQIVFRYDAILQRYACILVKDPTIAAALVKEVFEWVYELNGFNVDEKTLRSLLKGYTFKLASTWLLYGSSVTNPLNKPA